MGSLFRRGFGSYLDSKKYADLVVVINNFEYNVHRMVLAFSSEFFSRLLLSDFREASQSRIELKFPDPDQLFPDVVRFMYTGCVRITAHNAIPLLSMAEFLIVPSLIRLARDFIRNNITRENSLILLRKAIAFGTEDIVESCIIAIAKNFCHLQDRVDFAFLPHSVFLRLLRHQNLAVKSEYLLYQTILNYINAHSNQLSQNQINDLMETVRFRWMDTRELEEADHNPLVPRALIIEALLAKLKDSELREKEQQHYRPRHQTPASNNSNQSSGERNIRLDPRVAYGIRFEYSEDFDNNGILYWIATRSGREEWRNPHHRERLKVTASSIEKGDPSELVGRTPTELWTKDVPASWFCIDLTENFTIVPTCYTLRHGGNYKADSLRTWDFQGSVDGIQWILLRRHTNDPSLNGPFATHTWRINLPSNLTSSLPNPPPVSGTSGSNTLLASSAGGQVGSPPGGGPLSSGATGELASAPASPFPQPTIQPSPPFEGFRYFRILQTGHNSSNHNFLVLSGFEIYGELYEKS